MIKLSFKKGVNERKKVEISNLKPLTSEKRKERIEHNIGSCPRCGGEIAFYLYKGYDLDRCINCKGMFFDQGEVDGLIEKNTIGYLQRVLSLLGVE